jgi:hypothetical protein
MCQTRSARLRTGRNNGSAYLGLCQQKLFFQPLARRNCFCRLVLCTLQFGGQKPFTLPVIGMTSPYGLARGYFLLMSHCHVQKFLYQHQNFVALEPRLALRAEQGSELAWLDPMEESAWLTSHVWLSEDAAMLAAS